jgi:hypothetical protein
MADLPVFVKIPNIGFETLTAFENGYVLNATALAKTNIYKKVFTAGDSGSLIYQAKIQPFSANAACVIRFAIKDPQQPDGTLIYEQAMAASTNSATAANTKYDIQFNMKLQAGFEMYA